MDEWLCSSFFLINFEWKFHFSTWIKLYYTAWQTCSSASGKGELEAQWNCFIYSCILHIHTVSHSYIQYRSPFFNFNLFSLIISCYSMTRLSEDYVKVWTLRWAGRNPFCISHTRHSRLYFTWHEDNLMKWITCLHVKVINFNLVKFSNAAVDELRRRGDEGEFEWISQLSCLSYGKSYHHHRRFCQLHSHPLQPIPIRWKSLQV